MRNIVFSLILLLLVGCQSVYYHQRLPILEKPGRPQLVNIPASEMGKMSEQAQKDVVDNFGKLIDHVKKLEVSIDAYNQYASEQNEELDKVSRNE